jgi:hypothetical protein
VSERPGPAPAERWIEAMERSLRLLERSRSLMEQTPRTLAHAERAAARAQLTRLALAQFDDARPRATAGPADPG